MLTIDGRDKRPIYQQIVDRIILLVSTEVLQAGDRLPSIRAMAQDLGVNANTVQRAYNELELKNVINTVPKSGVFVKSNDVKHELKDKAKGEIEDLVSKYLNMGLKEKEIREIVAEVLQNVEGK